MNKNLVKTILETSIIIAIMQTVITYAILSYWQKDGFSMMECSFNSFATGFIYLIVCVIVPIFIVRKYIRKLDEIEAKSTKKFLIMISILLLSYLLHIGFDYILFMLDDSISKDIAETMSNIPGVEKYASKGDMAEFANIPIALINWSVNIIFGFIGICISYLFIKNA